MDRRKILLVLAAVIAALGTLLVFLYVQGADDRAKEDIEAVDVLQAVEDIDAGENFDDAVTAGKIKTVEVPKDQILPGAQADTQSLSGLRATTRLFAGEQVTSNKFGSGAVESGTLAIPEGLMAISVNLTDPARVAGFVNPGSEVTIFFTEEIDNNQPEYTATLLQRVLVLGVGTTSTITTTSTNESGESVTEELPRTLMTLAVTQEQATRIIFGSHDGELAFGLLNEDSEVDNGPVVKQDNFLPGPADDPHRRQGS
ncbi:Flp pilus assembly protein CpaB [Nocardioides alcanivorans]|uniref:Flp pilus assembly protein CpaB n=1 Tax=Nocardioides alcanivorans TaxID=2897352 RepID=UPI001F3729B6|nr:Flp pilus assembly protein CpaB [Nocardioides alcanivorans]